MGLNNVFLARRRAGPHTPSSLASLALIARHLPQCLRGGVPHDCSTAGTGCIIVSGAKEMGKQVLSKFDQIILEQVREALHDNGAE